MDGGWFWGDVSVGIYWAHIDALNSRYLLHEATSGPMSHAVAGCETSSARRRVRGRAVSIPLVLAEVPTF